MRNLGAGASVVVVTGASAGVGRATVREFARRGASLGLLARGSLAWRRCAPTPSGWRQPALSPSPPTWPTRTRSRRPLPASRQAELGAPDVWVNDAMVSVFAPVHQITPAELRRVMEVNYLGMVHGTLAALERMLSRDQGTVIQVGSALAYRGIPLQAPYCASQHARDAAPGGSGRGPRPTAA